VNDVERMHKVSWFLALTLIVNCVLYCVLCALQAMGGIGGSVLGAMKVTWELGIVDKVPKISTLGQATAKMRHFGVSRVALLFVALGDRDILFTSAYFACFVPTKCRSVRHSDVACCWLSVG
jgi:hypothetical protein